MPAAIASRLDAFEVDESLFEVDAAQSHAHHITHVQPFEPAHQSALNHRGGDAHERALRSHAGDDGIEAFANAPLQ